MAENSTVALELILKHKAQLLFHHTARSPGHDDVLIATSLSWQCQVSPRSNLSAMSPVYTPKLNTPHPPGPLRRLFALLLAAAMQLDVGAHKKRINFLTETDTCRVPFDVASLRDNDGHSVFFEL
jgi:hypothetical protein